MRKLFLIIAFIILSCNLYSQEAEWKVVDSLIYYHEEDQKYQTACRYFDIDCLDSNNCIAAPAMNLVWPWLRHTSDGGKTWETVYKEFEDNRIFSVDYVSENLCIASGEWGNYKISFDNCKSWERKKLETERNFNLMKVDFANENYGAMVTFYEYFVTNDGGKTWENRILIRNQEQIKRMNDISIPEEGAIRILFDNKEAEIDSIAVSNDDGQSWNFYTVNPSGRYLKGIRFLNKEIGWAYGAVQISQIGLYKDVIFKTTDGGKTWKEQLFDENRKQSKLIGMEFSDENNGISFAQWWVLRRTENGGEDWSEDLSMNNDISFIDPVEYSFINHNLIYACTFDNEILKYSKEPVSVVNWQEDNPTLSLHPNPATEHIIIEVDPLSGTVEIYNLLGIKVAEQAVTSGRQKIDVSGLPAGMYFLKAGDEVRKFVKR